MTETSGDNRFPPVEEIDPDSVPDWPHPVVTVRPEGIDIDGQPVQLPPGMAPESGHARQFALREVAARYTGLNRPLKVRARDPDGTAWDLILTPDGSVAPVSDEPAEYPGGKAPRRRGGRRRARPQPGARAAGQGGVPDKRRGLVAVGAFFAVVVVLGVGAFALTHRGSGPIVHPQHTAASTPPAANLPVPPPPGFQSRATWVVPMAENTTVAVTPDHQVALTNGDGDLEVRDVATGVLRWKGNLPINSSGELHVTTVDGHGALAFGETSKLLYWRLDDPNHTQHSIDLPEGAQTSFAGPSPLVVLPDQTAAYVTGDQAKLVDVPVGATAVSSTGSSVLAVNAKGKLWTLKSGSGAPPPPAQLRLPSRGAQLLRATPVSTGMFLVAWKYGSTRMVILYQSPGGPERGRKALLGGSLDNAGTGTDADVNLASDDGSVVTMGDMVVFPNVPRAYTVSGLNSATAVNGHLYGGDQTGAWVDVTEKGSRKIASQSSIPAAVDGDVALVAAQKLNETLLYALPSTSSTPEPSASASPSKGP
ncbi:MAG: hypothetical protein J2P24_09075 [Streptosporangiales bacterium]|nr:hypothetical protein [Streptosporangiales bacterium]MBO0889748.1 hypothetical protein [Acidothermales bacterium]